ncbi:hypothetical protein [Pseudomonas moorei]|uniref:hypothetical protein n=1 Tax=Pseudomonas moorei TaxID=395599 RepID=UPI001FF3A860|nr:hypothetical protein [Pseudomonas moorei]
MKAIPYLALTLAAFSSMSVAASSGANISASTLIAGTTITATFESKMALKEYRIGGAELMQVGGDLKCKLIVATGFGEDGLRATAFPNDIPGRAPAGLVVPQELICNDGATTAPVQDVLLPARSPIGNDAPEKLEFIVLKTLNF